jgi:hypothetical protein
MWLKNPLESWELSSKLGSHQPRIRNTESHKNPSILLPWLQTHLLSAARMHSATSLVPLVDAVCRTASGALRHELPGNWHRDPR